MHKLSKLQHAQQSATINLFFIIHATHQPPILQMGRARAFSFLAAGLRPATYGASQTWAYSLEVGPGLDILQPSPTQPMNIPKCRASQPTY